MLLPLSSTLAKAKYRVSQHTPFISPQIDQAQLKKFYAGHVAAITGAGSGIGLELAKYLAKLGCDLALSDINAETLAITKEKLAGYDVQVHTKVVDVTDYEAVTAWADDIMAEFGQVNFIFNNAGVALTSTVEGMSIDEIKWVMDINFWGVVYGTKAFLPLIKNSVKLAKENGEKSRHGHIINISSLFGLTAQPTQSAYNASKFAVRGFTESLRHELDIENCGVSVTSVHPGGIRTNIINSSRGNDSIKDLGMKGGSESIKKLNKLLKYDPNDAADVILMAVANNESRCLIGDDARMLDVMQRVTPSHYTQVVNRLNKLAKRSKKSKRR